MKLISSIKVLFLLLVFKLASCQIQPPCTRVCPVGEVCQRKPICFTVRGAERCFGSLSVCVPKPTLPPLPPPSCNHVKCRDGQVCVYQNVICKKPPCYPIPRCIENGCKTVRCTADTECKMVEIPGSDPNCSPFPQCRYRASCVPKPTLPPPRPLTCETVKCSDGQVCVYQQVQCVRAPCHPVPVCIANGCITVKCSATTECKMIEIPGSNPFCSPFPKCRYQASCVPKPTLPPLELPPPSCADVSCPNGQVCAYQPVICKKEPCHPRPVCINNRCATVRCGFNTVCQLQEIAGSNPHCSPFPSCRYQFGCVPRVKPKPGFCPDPRLVSQANVNLCTYDNDCPADLICCPGASRGGLNCTAPAYPNPCSTIKCPPAPNIVGGTCVVRNGNPSCADRVCQPGSFFCRDGKQCYCSDGGEVICTDVAAPPDCSN